MNSHSDFISLDGKKSRLYTDLLFDFFLSSEERKSSDPEKALLDYFSFVERICLSRIARARDTGQTENIVEKNEVEIDALPPEEREKIDSQLQIILRIIKEMEEKSGVCRDDLLYDALYEEHGIGRREVTQRLVMLVKKGCVSTPKPGYYMRTTPARDNGTISKQL